MKILLDTHIFLWFISGDPRLSADLRDAIRHTDVDVLANVASLTRISGANSYYFYSRLQGFIGEKQPQLKECPIIRTSAFSFAPRLLVSTFSNACQIFNCHSCVLLQCQQDKLFADAVVQPSLIASLTPRQPLPNLTRSTTSRPCAFRCFLLFEKLLLLRIYLYSLLSVFRPTCLH